MTSNIPTTFVDSAIGVAALIDVLARLSTDPPAIYIDLEGIKLSRNGSISLITILVRPATADQHMYLVDIHTLGSLAFTVTHSIGKSQKDLKTILEDPAVPKVFFDVRNDSDALYAHFGISLAGIIDVQLMEIASRKQHASKKLLNGLARCIDSDLSLPRPTKLAWKLANAEGKRMFAPELGGSYAVFNARPLSDEMKAYCLGDVLHMPALRELYLGKLSPGWKGKVEVETKRRVLESQSPGYQPHGAKKALGPWA